MKLSAVTGLGLKMPKWIRSQISSLVFGRIPLTTYLTATSFLLNFNPGVAQLVGHLVWELESKIRSPPEKIANSPILSADPPFNPS